MLSCVWLFATPWIAACQASLSFISQSLLKLSPLSWWCHPTILSSTIPIFSCLQSFPATGSFLMNWLFSSGGQSIGALASVILNGDLKKIQINIYCLKLELPWWLRRQSICLQCRRPGFDPWVGKIPWRRKWQPTPVLLPGKSHGQRNLVGYSPWGCKESDTTERLHFYFWCSMHIKARKGSVKDKIDTTIL